MKTKNILSKLNLIDEFDQQSIAFKNAYIARLNAVQEVIIEDIQEWLEKKEDNFSYDLDFVLSDLCLNLELWHLPGSNSCSEGNDLTNWTMQEIWVWDTEESIDFLASEYWTASIKSFIQSHHLIFCADNSEIDSWLNDCKVILQNLLSVFSESESIMHMKSAHVALNIILTRMLSEVYTLRQFRTF